MSYPIPKNSQSGLQRVTSTGRNKDGGNEKSESKKPDKGLFGFTRMTATRH